MSALDRTPEHTGFLQPTKFLLTFDRIPNVTYFCQEANIPGVTIPAIIVPTPMLDYHVTGNKMTFSTFNIKFMIDSRAEDWKSIYNWILSLASPHGFEERNQLTALQNQYKNTDFKGYSDAVLTALSNLNNPIFRVHLVGLFPISLSDIQFDTTLSADHIMTADASFSVKYFDFLES